jgi:hypothetical protein
MSNPDRTRGNSNLLVVDIKRFIIRNLAPFLAAAVIGGGVGIYLSKFRKEVYLSQIQFPEGLKTHDAKVLENFLPGIVSDKVWRGKFARAVAKNIQADNYGMSDILASVQLNNYPPEPDLELALHRYLSVLGLQFIQQRVPEPGRSGLLFGINSVGYSMGIVGPEGFESRRVLSSIIRAYADVLPKYLEHRMFEDARLFTDAVLQADSEVREAVATYETARLTVLKDEQEMIRAKLDLESYLSSKFPQAIFKDQPEIYSGAPAMLLYYESWYRDHSNILNVADYPKFREKLEKYVMLQLNYLSKIHLAKNFLEAADQKYLALQEKNSFSISSSRLQEISQSLLFTVQQVEHPENPATKVISNSYNKFLIICWFVSTFALTAVFFTALFLVIWEKRLKGAFKRRQVTS